MCLDRFANLPCQQLGGGIHTNDSTTPCTVCKETAETNGLNFIQHTVLPQLEALKSKTRGIDGFVMPPSWIAPDALPPWRGNLAPLSTLPLEEPLYHFVHGDIGTHNIIMDVATLQVKALIDWEYAGFYQAGWERWPGTFDRTVYLSNCYQLASVIPRFLAVEFLECCEKSEDKEELAKLVEEGEIPDPVELMRTLASV